MTREAAKLTERDCELTLTELEAVNGGAMVDYFHTLSPLPPGPFGGVYHLNPQPLPPG